MPIITLFLIVLTTVLILTIWPYLVDLCSRTILPFLRRKLGTQVAEPMAALLSWVDRKACPGRKVVMDGWRTLTGRVKRLRTTYTKKSPTRLIERTEAHVADSDTGKTLVSVQEYEIPWEDAPEAIRDEMDSSGATSGQLDVKEALEEAIREAAQEDGIELIG